MHMHRKVFPNNLYLSLLSFFSSLSKRSFFSSPSLLPSLLSTLSQFCNCNLFFFAGYGGYRGHYYGKRSADAEPRYGYYGHGWVGLARTHSSIYIITIIVRYGGYRGGYHGHAYGHGKLLISYLKFNPMCFCLCRLRILRLKSSRSSCWFNQI